VLEAFGGLETSFVAWNPNEKYLAIFWRKNLDFLQL
jgi:hypothetical protein